MPQVEEISTVELNDQRGNTSDDVDVIPKLATEDGNTTVIEHPRVDSPSTGQDHSSDIASVHSVPVTNTIDSTTSNSQRQTTNEPTAPVPRLPPPSPLRSSTIQEEGSLSQQQRRSRHRSAIEPRSSNRLSGFFSNLIHRREPLSTSSREPIREDNTASHNPSRSSSPVPPRVPSPPPPSLPPPTLVELGLSLSPLTSELSPSHFTSPPASGAFLAPHYLLLCHAQGLDVIPLVSPPAPQPYALIRRVSFKSVVVMEQRGVLVAIAGRRDGVRVYALEEVKKAIEWRIEVEVKRERDRNRREAVKKMAMRTLDNSDRDSAEKSRKSLSTPPPDSDRIPTTLIRKGSQHNLPSPSPPPVPLIPRSATPRAPKKKAKSHPTDPTHPVPASSPSGHPPPYASSAEIVAPILQSRPSHISLRSRSRGGSISNVITVAPVQRPPATSRHRDRDNEDSKADWAESSDEEAIDVVAAGPSGSHLDERTSASNQLSSPPRNQSVIGHTLPVPVHPHNAPGSLRRNRPTDLDLSLTRSTTIPPPEPSPAPTLQTLRQALSNSPISMHGESADPEAPPNDLDDDDEDVDGHISLAQALLESRIPDLPPLGTRRPQEPIFITPTAAGRAEELPDVPHTSHTPSSMSRASTSNNSTSNSRRRRRWSIMITSPSPDTASVASTPNVSTTPTTPFNRFSRSHSFRSNNTQPLSARSATELSNTPPATAVPPIPDSATLPPPPSSSRSSRFIPRIISNAFQGRRSDERPSTTVASPVDTNESNRWTPGSQTSPPPKLEYVKLPGTKGALLVKAVETARKSFLAILCGEHGEKVELFAGTYRTALGLSRTFILPDSPRSLELQLQGDDLVEVFLVFAQNVFGLEPATVRVREVRIGRAERRAARRRARENRLGDPATNDNEALDDETNVNVSIGVSVPVIAGGGTGENGDEGSATPTLIANEHPGSQNDQPSTPNDTVPSNTSTAQSEELLLLATAQMGPYTTFQQLNFAPNFPLASIADEYIIPPTYPTFMEYKAEHEPENGEDSNLPTQFSPPGLPVPAPSVPSKWYYRDPKNVIHGPWKASLMQAWYKDGLLPLDLPVRREDDTEYILLKDLRLQCVDPTQPFKVTSTSTTSTSTTVQQPESLPLLSPISLLAQPKHFGPPALFFSSRGGHSTSIVDARGRSVLKGRFIWTNDEEKSVGKMGDVRRLEAFDVKNRSVLVAMRQGGLEVVDLGDALLKPADESRTILPHYNPPMSNTNRRKPYVWKIGMPLISTSSNLDSVTVKGKASNMSTQGRKSSLGPSRISGTKNESITNDVDIFPQDEVLYLGRKEDEVYICEKGATSFRILRLSPTTDETS
ncbi:hypothetical protein CVT24_011533 [Panaeolus cyanescens]|uniref:GYF domain-containing protein n=1 Tax=Panaeolus cyanescens TaxID=181874 RepID=A0A409VM63_9AGAR|nr:hypothetical protein CVT24_011533 [Panaeolus cyanescens]